MPTNAPSSILLSSARLSTPAWLQIAPPRAASRIGVASRIPLLSSSTVKTLKNPSILATLSLQGTASFSGEPLPCSGNILFIQLPCRNKEDNKSNDGASQLARDIQVQLQTELCTELQPGKQDADDEHPKGMDLTQDGGCETVEAQANGEARHDSTMDTHHLDGSRQPGQRAADEHGSDGRAIAEDASKKCKSPGLPGHALFVARLGPPQVNIDNDDGKNCNHKTNSPLRTWQE